MHSRFAAYATTAAKNMGEGTSFVDHFQAAADTYLMLGAIKTNPLSPKDRTHTSPEGPDLVV
jgi:rhamnogalacturonan acetylesterase